ncbi:phospholipid-translocating P-type ATPase [Morchella snyderi]|nr:phospholipid-translocating P-type ATPase [Morchella snyderi]
MAEPNTGNVPRSDEESAEDQPSSTSGTVRDSNSDIPIQSTGGGIPRVRFSTDIDRSEPLAPGSSPTGEKIVATAGLTIDTSPRNVQGESLEIRPFGRKTGDTNSATDAPPSALSLTSPASPRKRNRGYSLRRQLFFRNVHGQMDQNAGLAHSSVNDMGIELKSVHPSHEVKNQHIEFQDGAAREGAEDEGKEKADHDHSKRQESLPPISGSLPQYSLWAHKQSKTFRVQVQSYYKNIRQLILRYNEAPPSKEGRRIPVDAERKEPLIDERTLKEYIGNTIRSSRYTIWSFLPKQLFAQFSKLANFYFLCVSILQMIPTLSTTGTYTTIVPLLFFITLSMTKEGYDDYRRYKLDKVENNRCAQILHSSKASDDCDLPSTPRFWAETKWRNIRVGDIVKLERDNSVPADIIILHSDGPRGIAYVETMALDGETNLKSKQALPIISEQCDTIDKLGAFKAQVVVEDPNMDLYNFEGKVTVGNETKPLTNSQVIYRGSVIRNTSNMWGLVIFTGEESKIRMNANKNPRTKAPSLQAIVNKIVLIIVVFVIALAVFNTVAYRLWRNRTERRSWYLTNSSVAFFPIFASYVIMFNTLIPLSLYVSLEIIKLAQMFLLNDIDMYDPETDTPMEARTSTINEDCGQVSYIFSDKTGTLTDNAMLFRKLSVGGQAWLHDLDIQREAGELAGRSNLGKRRREKGKGKAKIIGRSKSVHMNTKGTDPEPHRTRKSFGDMAYIQQVETTLPKSSLDGRLRNKSSSNSLQWRSTAIPQKAQPQLSTMDLLYYLQNHPHTFFARKARFFLLSIALCHTCIPEVDDDGNITYQAASPDELALVRAAQELGYITIDRQINKISIKTFPNGPMGEPLIEDYEILEVIEFSSKRKRMSIIVRMPNGKFCVFCKGADTTIIELLRLRDLAKQKALEVERRANKRKSLEAQEVIRRTSMQRTSIGGRSSIGGRPSFGGPGRPSMSTNRLKPIQDEFSDWLRDKEQDVDMSSTDDESIHSRPSAQFANRHSIAFGEINVPLEREISEDMVDENIAADEAKVVERCFAHINDFATDGLRTLLYAHRFLDEQEYTGWKKIYAEATTSLVDRQSLIEKAADMIERDFELGGATAIEDKLQKGVPETIDKLRRAGIKLWMLTGDKRETAINIGHSCRLIKDYSNIIVLDKRDGYIERKMAEAILEINAGKVAHSVVVVDGGTLASIDEDETLKSLFFDIAIITDSVICCRASPSQKASLVKTIRTKVNKSVTLAIGDGANDIAMIQEAHVGIGITGKEGLQAARVSDYSMAQFRFLLKFLLVHGRWNYVRICKYTVGTFWKELLFYLTQALFQRSNGFTGTSFYESWSLSMFNTLFTSLPVIILGIFEKDLSPATLLAVPELYRKGQLNEGFNFRIYLGWMFLASSQAVLNYYMMFTLYAPRLTVDNGIYAMGVITYSVVVTLVSAKLQLLETHNKTVIVAATFVLSVGGWFLWNIILGETYSNNVIYNVKDGILRRFGKDLTWWLVYIFCLSACLILDLALISIRAAFWPTDVDVFQEIEKSKEMRERMEEAASVELQQSWNQNQGRSKAELEIEGEVQEFLDRPRVMEEGRTPGGKTTSPCVDRISFSGDRGEAEDDINAHLARRFGSIRR